MAPGGQPRPRRPEVFTENWPETARQRVIALREKLYDLEKGYERLAQNGSKEAKKWLANLDYNCRILPMCIDAIARLEQCPEVDQIDNVLCCLERNPTEQLPEQAFTVITKIKNPR